MPASRTHLPADTVPVCQNCGNPARFVVSIAYNFPTVEGVVGPPWRSVSLACADCQSTHVE